MDDSRKRTTRLKAWEIAAAGFAAGALMAVVTVIAWLVLSGRAAM